MRLILVIFTIFVSFHADARSELTGSWCQKYDDFTEILIISDNFDVEIFTLGNSSGEIHGHRIGYLSLGASHQFLSIHEIEFPIFDIGTSGFLKNKLIIDYVKGGKVRYKKCQTNIK